MAEKNKGNGVTAWNVTTDEPNDDIVREYFGNDQAYNLIGEVSRELFEKQGLEGDELDNAVETLYAGVNAAVSNLAGSKKPLQDLNGYNVKGFKDQDGIEHNGYLVPSKKKLEGVKNAVRTGNRTALEMSVNSIIVALALAKGFSEQISQAIVEESPLADVDCPHVDCTKVYDLAKEMGLYKGNKGSA